VEARLESFGGAVCTALRRAPELRGLSDRILSEGTVYWLCKALSINYGLAEVLQLIQRKVGAFCSIESWNMQGVSHTVVYSVDVAPGPALQVGISWCGKDNLISCDPITAQKSITGTVSRVETQFSLPPQWGFAPEYHVQMELYKSDVPQHMHSLDAHSPKSEVASERLLVPTPLRGSLIHHEGCIDSLTNVPSEDPPLSPRASVWLSQSAWWSAEINSRRDERIVNIDEYIARLREINDVVADERFRNDKPTLAEYHKSCHHVGPHHIERFSDMDDAVADETICDDRPNLARYARSRHFGPQLRSQDTVINSSSAGVWTRES
jgi:hypothetical protein